jgi:hypothetical protein
MDENITKLTLDDLNKGLTEQDNKSINLFDELSEKILALEVKMNESVKSLEVSLEKLTSELESLSHFIKCYCVQIKLNNF